MNGKEKRKKNDLQRCCLPRQAGQPLWNYEPGPKVAFSPECLINLGLKVPFRPVLAVPVGKPFPNHEKSVFLY
jgi:hypothetical protein